MKVTRPPGGTGAALQSQKNLRHARPPSNSTTLAGTAPIDVLAETSPSVRFKKPHPAVWITSHPRARIVGITLGHDQRTHDLEPFKTLLANAVRWASRATP